MKPQWTADQQKVIDLRDSNILVSAAAGSGNSRVGRTNYWADHR